MAFVTDNGIGRDNPIVATNKREITYPSKYNTTDPTENKMIRKFLISLDTFYKPNKLN